MGDKEYHEENDATPKDQLREETKEWSYLQLNRGDRDLGIQLLDTALKRSHQDRLINPTLGTQQSAHKKDTTPTSANVMRSVSATPSVLKFHIYMIMVLADLSARCDDSGPDEPLSIKQAMSSPY